MAHASNHPSPVIYKVRYRKGGHRWNDWVHDKKLHLILMELFSVQGNGVNWHWWIRVFLSQQMISAVSRTRCIIRCMLLEIIPRKASIFGLNGTVICVSVSGQIVMAIMIWRMFPQGYIGIDCILMLGLYQLNSVVRNTTKAVSHTSILISFAVCNTQ